MIDEAPEGFRLTPFGEGHIPAAAAIEKVCFANPWSEQSLRYLTLRGPAFGVACETRDGILAGYCSAESAGLYAYIMNVAVLPDYRRRGLATAMIGRIIGLCLERGAMVISLDVRESNAGARALYEKLGFRAEGTLPRHYRNPVEAAIVMNLYPDAENE